MLLDRLRQLLARIQTDDRFPNIEKNVLTARSFDHLKTAMGWTLEPVLDADHLYRYEYVEDLNGRRVRDAEAIMGACRNSSPGSTILEIGTSYGRTTALMSRNAPESTIYTVNLPPEGAEHAGRNITHVLESSEIGRCYREQGCTNVRQVLANTAEWEPDMGSIDVAFIDGCHDATFVYNDTVKVLRHARPGGVILWHDFNPELVSQFHWLGEVARGIERLYRDNRIQGRILHLQDSWVGIWRVPSD